ncbi:unnamed protein product [Durusdinium trenchii]|uniref:Glycosyltransferase 2-like domain-containing protein n=2 Tax=Durusdinium trenchii TaxID=1381693 RepID=A0ABP0HVK2_9DINO
MPSWQGLNQQAPIRGPLPKAARWSVGPTATPTAQAAYKTVGYAPPSAQIRNLPGVQWSIPASQPNLPSMCATQSMVVPSQAAGPMVLTANRSILRGVPACPTSIVAKGPRTVTRMSPSPLSNSNIAPPQIAKSLPVAARIPTSPSPLPQTTSFFLHLPVGTTPVGTAPIVATPVVAAPGAAPGPTPSPTTSPPNLPLGPGPNGTKPFGVPVASSLPNMDANTSEKELGNESPPKAPKRDQPIVSSSPLSHTSRANNNSIGLSSRQGHVRQPSVMSLERMLFEMTNGDYNPTEMAKKRRVPVPMNADVMCEIPGRVSIVAPTMDSRKEYHTNLYRCFVAQDYADKELIVVETYVEKPSRYLRKFASRDERVVHVPIQVSPGKDITVGLKRNMTLHLASGEYIVNFDDDDLYAPGYVPRVIQLISSQNLVGLTLSAWYNYYIGQGVCTFSDPESWEEWADDQQDLDEILYGYGFSYSHKRTPSLRFWYPNVGFAEDAPFFLKLRDMFGKDKVQLYKDEDGFCVHVMHRANTAQVLGSRIASRQEIGRLKVTALEPFREMIDQDYGRFGGWLWRPPVPTALSEEALARGACFTQKRGTCAQACV